MKKYTYYKKYKNSNKLKFKYLIFVIILLIIIFLIFDSNNKNKLNISLSNLESFKISSQNIIKLEDIANKYNLIFYEMLAYYAIENNFFDDKELNIDDIEKEFIINYKNIKSKYKKKDIEPYINIVKNLIEDIKVFPIPSGYEKDYVYSDSYGAERNYGGKREHKGTDIMDRENIEGRIPVVSMTDGIVENIGWNEKGGYRIGIKSKTGNYYYYAHLDSFEENMQKGTKVLAGDKLGYMGSTGYSKVEGTKGKFPVHLHIGIELETTLTNNEIWINPYPFLTIIENKNINENKIN